VAIPPDGPVTAGQFVEWLFLAENFNPNAQTGRWQRRKEALRAAFVKPMGAEAVYARLLRWSGAPPADDERPVCHGEIPDGR
jgi:hypothetical protein